VTLKIALIGASGMIGSRLLQEALRRKHTVVAIVRHTDKLPQSPNIVPSATDVLDTAALTGVIRGTEAVIYAFNSPKGATIEERVDAQRRAILSTLAAAKAAGVPRILAVGGAGTLEVAPGVRNVDSPNFPQQWKAGATSTAVVKELLARQHDVAWTSLSPSHNLVAGERTGKFRLGLDQLLVDDKGESKISIEDYAVALIDELERPSHTGRRFTVGY
jgi:uncharacterized protein